MSTTNQKTITDRQVITAFSFYEFLTQAQELIQKGYVISDTNENFPQAYVGSYSAALLKFEDSAEEDVQAEIHTVVREDTPKEVPQNKPASTKGRKPNVK